MILTRDGVELVLQSRRPNGPEPYMESGRLVLQAEAQWLLSGPTDVLAGIAAVLGSTAERLTAELLLLNFGNAVGLIDVPVIGRVEVVSGKWSTAHFDQMLRDLMAVASGLPYAAGAVTALPYDRSVAAREDVLYHAFVYLRHILLGAAASEDQVVPALNLILKEPHRHFEQSRRTVPLELASRVDAAGLVKLAGGGGHPVRVSSAQSARLPLARALRGHIPTEVDERQVRSTYDTPENRFIKAFLGQALGVIEGMRRVVGRAKQATPFHRRILADCDLCEQALRPVRHDAFWDQIGPMVRVPVGSTVLQRRRGYREVFGHFSRLRLASQAPVDREQVQRLLETKDIAELYELWVYFMIVREMEQLLGRPIRAGRPQASEYAVGAPRALEVVWANGARVSYNLTFSRSQVKDRRSFSAPLRPDVAIEVTSGPNSGLHLFDAKFKLDRVDDVLAIGSIPTNETADERVGTFKRGDLYKMHTYRDAIQRARSVWILYPGDDTRFYSVAGKPIYASDALPDVLNGVGALPLRPDDTSIRSLRAALCRLLAVGSE